MKLRFKEILKERICQLFHNHLHSSMIPSDSNNRNRRKERMNFLINPKPMSTESRGLCSDHQSRKSSMYSTRQPKASKLRKQSRIRTLDNKKIDSILAKARTSENGKRAFSLPQKGCRPTIWQRCSPTVERNII